MKSLWLQNRKYDLALFHFPALACLLLLVPYFFFGSHAVLPIYVGYLVFFGFPHYYLTGSTFMPRNANKLLDHGLLRRKIFSALVFCLLLPLTMGTELGDWLLTGIGLFAIWHIYRQHDGIAKAYDAVQARRTGDLTIFEDRRAMNLFFGLAMGSVVVWTFTHSEVYFSLSSEEKFRFVHPTVPWEVFRLYLAVTLFSGSWAFKRAIVDRAREAKFIPWPQISLMACALATYVVPCFFLPVEAMPLSIAISTTFHAIQYFGFVWMYERHRTADLPRYDALLGAPQRLVREGAWKHYAGMALGFSAGVTAVYGSLPHLAGELVIYFIAFSHYLVEGVIWQGEHNPALPRVIDRLAGIAMEPAARLRRVI